MAIWAIANQKGGVGKSTTGINLGAALARRGLRVLLVDSDPQSNATSGLGIRPGDTPTIYDLLLAAAPQPDAAILPTRQQGLHLIAATPALAGAEVELAGAPAREHRLQRALAGAAARFDQILIDCPPSLGLLTVNALCTADTVLVPVQCEYLALEGLGHLITTIDLVRRNLNPHLAVGAVLLTMFDGRTNLAQQVVDEVRQHFPETLQTVIPRSIRLGEAPSHGRTIFEYAPQSAGAVAYAQAAAELQATAFGARQPPVQAAVGAGA